MFSLTTNELKAIQALIAGGLTIKELGELVGVSRRASSNIVHTLRDKGIADYPGTRSSKVSLSGRLHAHALRQFIIEGTRPIEVLAGGKLLILLSIHRHAKTVERISLETDLKVSTVERFLRELSKCGLVLIQDRRYRVPLSDPLCPILASYARGSCQVQMEHISSGGVITWYDGLEFLFTADAISDYHHAHVTGLSAMSGYGLKFFTPRNEYHYRRWDGELNPITVALDILLAKPASKESVRYSLLLLMKEHADMSVFKDDARNYGLDREAQAISDYLSGRTISEEWFPSELDVHQLLELYGVG